MALSPSAPKIRAFFGPLEVPVVALIEDMASRLLINLEIALNDLHIFPNESLPQVVACKYCFSLFARFMCSYDRLALAGRISIAYLTLEISSSPHYLESALKSLA